MSAAHITLRIYFPIFRVLVTQFVAVYFTKADSNSTDERREGRELIAARHQPKTRIPRLVRDTASR